jgi:hypothetical protein
MLITFPLGLLGMAAIFDLIFALNGSRDLVTASYWMIAAGIVIGLLAAVFGLWDWLAIAGGTRRQDPRDVARRRQRRHRAAVCHQLVDAPGQCWRWSRVRANRDAVGARGPEVRVRSCSRSTWCTCSHVPASRVVAPGPYCECYFTDKRKSGCWLKSNTAVRSPAAASRVPRGSNCQRVSISFKTLVVSYTE